MATRKHRWPKTQDGIEDAALHILEWLAEQGVNATLRVDADRLAEDRPAWTFAASGGPLPHGIRADGATPDQCLSMALAELRTAGINVPY
ncbi:hypothetical protein [Actinomadura montaniterrae]|uniref:YcaO domain-containing protein n=1 Tax=Actinomadura montaniterrae TaxID=1803903 RepID=A0A6L3VZ09_9ACTN|nr:hypothetical protein [Actinomadura montaniterrae]KAB2381036.1 hypothetical protein F9B16_16610 [Actinomadura montaniterrae]